MRELGYAEEGGMGGSGEEEGGGEEGGGREGGEKVAACHIVRIQHGAVTWCSSLEESLSHAGGSCTSISKFS